MSERPVGSAVTRVEQTSRCEYGNIFLCRWIYRKAIKNISYNKKPNGVKVSTVWLNANLYTMNFLQAAYVLANTYLKIMSYLNSHKS